MKNKDVIGFDALFNSMNKCRLGVMWKASTASYVLNSIERTLKLSDALSKGTYKANKPMQFTITSPKKRDIISVSFRDRVYQRSLNDNILYPSMARSFIYDNCACQKGKGTDFARNRLKTHLHKYYRKHGANGYVLQCDIKGYYPNMRHDVAEQTVQKRVDTQTFDAVKAILDDQYGGDIGYNPGSQMVQILGISMLDGVDHFVKEKLCIKHYIRYMDDFILVGNDCNQLARCKTLIEAELKKIGFELHPNKTKLYAISEGIKFLGFTFKLTKTGKVLMLIDSKSVKRERKKLYRLAECVKRGECPKEKADECYASWRNHASKGDSHNLLIRMDNYYKSLWKGTDYDYQTQGNESE